MYIAFYISSHGFGHMTRCLAIINRILNKTRYNIYIVCGKRQNDFARVYLNNFTGRVIYKDMTTDIGLINKINTLEIDKIELEKSLINFIRSWNEIAISESEIISRLNVRCIISDISPIGLIVGKKLNIHTSFLSNFSWIEPYEYLNINEYIVNKFKKVFYEVDNLVTYDLSIGMDYIQSKDIHNVGMICREVDKYKVMEINKKYGKSIFITAGKSTNLRSINIKNFSGTIFVTEGLNINSWEKATVVKLPIDILDTQNYIAASDIVIAKAGWGTIAEALIGHTRLVLIERPTSYEDILNILKLKKQNLAISITEEDLNNLDIEVINNISDKYIDYEKLRKYRNDLVNVEKIILENCNIE